MSCQPALVMHAVACQSHTGGHARVQIGLSRLQVLSTHDTLLPRSSCGAHAALGIGIWCRACWHHEGQANIGARSHARARTAASKLPVSTGSG